MKAIATTVVAATLAMSAVHAQERYPAKPVRLVLPFAAGSTTDTLARDVAHKSTQNTGAQFIVDARPGANGILGVDSVAKAARAR